VRSRREHLFRNEAIRHYGQNGGKLVLLRLSFHNQDFAARERSLAAIIAGRGFAFPPFATVRRCLVELGTAEAVERLKQQKNRHQADRDVDATAHSI
jgi:hypothetical protein